MILYKYLSFSTGKLLLKHCSIAFSRPWDFNDPFELHCAWNDFGDSAFASIAMRCLHETTLMLCLTKEPLNPLMWAHYCDSHMGFVIGIDVDECGWLDESKCMIPLQHGKVIYPKNRPAEQTNDCPMDIGNERSYKPNLKNRYQQYFLTKPICWKYEREVRVVKCISDEEWSQEHGKSSILELSNQVSVSVKKYLHAIPRSAIKEIYLGLNHPCNKGTLATNDFDITPWLSEASVVCCRLSPTSWDLHPVKFPLTTIV